jgi:protein-S-isoprenylcysteine O-methyltransferase Ste14
VSRFFDGFQLFALAFFLLVFVGRTLYLRLVKHISPITLGAGKKGFWRFAEMSFFVGLAAWIIEVLLHVLPVGFTLFPAPFDTRVINSVPAQCVGVALLVAGLVLFVWALIAFGDSWRVGIDESAPGALVTEGVFAVSRNPIFLFLDLYFLGTFLINGTLVFLLFFAFTAVGLHLQILQEEEFLAAAYGDTYHDYCAATGRYLGRRGAGRGND